VEKKFFLRFLEVVFPSFP